LKQQGDGAGEHLNYNKLRVAGHGLSNTRARQANTANRAPNMLMHYRHVFVHVCTISILWNFHTNPYYFQLNNKLKQQGDGAGETSITTNYELQGTGWATRAPVAQTLQTVRQTCSGTTATLLCLCARFPSCGIFAPTETNELKQQGDGASEHLKNDKLRVAGHGRAGQHARLSHKHCKACAKHAHVSPPLASIHWYGFVLFFRVKPHSFSLIGFLAD
jgi:hypothetical protein